MALAMKSWNSSPPVFTHRSLRCLGLVDSVASPLSPPPTRPEERVLARRSGDRWLLEGLRVRREEEEHCAQCAQCAFYKVPKMEH